MNNKYLFDNFYNNAPGIWYFIPKNPEAYIRGKPSYGFGCIKYAEGSVYTGNLYFDGKNYNKIGIGQQDFTLSFLSKTSLPNQRIYKYVGEYDYRKNDWIYGRGVLYFVDQNNTPSYFVRGIFDGLNKVDDDNKSFDYNQLLFGYRKEMELDYCDRDALFRQEMSNYIHNSKLKALLIGDSYFEFWQYAPYSGKTFYESYDVSQVLNLGLGGTTFANWFKYLPLITFDKDPQKIIISLGINDMHFFTTIPQAIDNFKKCLQIIRKKFNDSKVYLLTVTYTPYFVNKRIKISRYNNRIKKVALEENVGIIDISKILKSNAEKTGENYFHEDQIHLNYKGYQLLKACLDEVLENDNL